ncbi:MAG: YfdX family protein [Magnetococcales bacterium]|nr:YfdX family protein [Magnetococcales bacterium]
MSDQTQTTALQEEALGTQSVPPETKSEMTTNVQPNVEKEVEQKAADKRKQHIEEAVAALAQTEQALVALGENDANRALRALAEVIGKLELVVTRNPRLALAPVDVRTTVHDLFANTAAIKAQIDEAQRALKHDEIQKARRLLAGMASEVMITTSHIPLATYPQAIKAIVPLIDQGQLNEAKAALQAVLGTLVETIDTIALPVLRARLLLKQAEGLAENDKRTEQDNKQLTQLFGEIRNQLEMAELLGYGKKGDFKPIHEQVKEIEKISSGGKSGKGWFDKIKGQVSKLF